MPQLAWPSRPLRSPGSGGGDPVIPVPLPVLEVLAQAFGVHCADLVKFAGGGSENDGVIYAYRAPGSRRLLKVMAIPEDARQGGLFCLDERLKFMRFLGEHGASIAFPLLSPQGAIYETVAYADHVWIGYTMDLAPGHEVPPDTWDSCLFQRWGQAIGKLHRLAQEYPSWQSSVEPETGTELLTWREEWEGFHNWCPDDQVKLEWERVKERLEELPAPRDAFGFIHNDPHIWNLRYDGERVTLLDFDVANHHWFATDISIACQSLLFAQTGGMGSPLRDRAKLVEFLSCFRAGYQLENMLADEWWDRLDLFIAYRRILLFIVMHGWIGSDPGRLDAWQQMILEHPQLLGPWTRQG